MTDDKEFQNWIHYWNEILPKLDSDIFNRRVNFFEYEKLAGTEFSPVMTSPDPATIDAFVKAHPYWATKDGKLKETTHWTGEHGMTMKEMAIKLGMAGDYHQVYKVASKFMHASPIIRNLYHGRRGTCAIPEEKHPTFFNLMTAHYCMEGLMEFCEFFGVEFKES